MILLCPVNISQNIGENFDCRRIVMHHQECETQIIVETDVAGRHMSVQSLVVSEIDGVKRLERKAVIAEQTMKTQQTNGRKVADRLLHSQIL